MEADFSELLDNLPQMVWKVLRKKNDVELVYSNRNWKEYTDKCIFDKDLVHPDDLYACLVVWQSTKDKFQVKRRLKNRQGQYNWFLTRALRKGDFWFGTCTNINETMQLNKEKIVSEKVRLDLIKSTNIKNNIAEKARLDLVVEARKLATKVIQKEIEKQIAEKTRIALSEHAKILASDVNIAEKTRLELLNHAKMLASEAEDRSNEKEVAEETRLTLLEHAKFLASEAVERSNEKEVAEETRLDLLEHAKFLASEAVERSNEKEVAEETRLDLLEHAKFLAREAVDRSNEKNVAEERRLGLLEYAKVLADKVKIAERARIILSKGADKLALKAQQGEKERKDLFDEVSILSDEKVDITEKILQMKFEKLVADKEVAKLIGEKKVSDEERIELREEARKLSVEVFDRTYASQQLKIIINSIPIILWVIDNKGNFTMSEGNGLTQIHETPGRLVGTSIYDFYPKSEHELLKDAMNGKNFTRNIIIKSREYETYHTPMTFNTGILGVIILARDITEQKQLAAEKSEIYIREQTAIRNAEIKSVFLSNMSHEIRTPLYGMMSYVEFLLETVLTNSQREHTETLSKSIEYLTVIVNDIIDISKLETGQLKLDLVSVFDPSRTIREICNILKFSATTKDLSLDFEISKYLPSHVKGDINRFEQVLVNIINNAVKFTENGSVTVNASCNEFKKEDTQVQFTIQVKDTGIGMSQEKIKTLFELFSQSETQYPRSTSGPGLGLYISQKIAKLMQGEISVESEIGKGTTVTFKLMLEMAIPDLKITSLVQKTRPLVGITILVMEDNLINQRIVKKVLSSAGAIVSCADNGLVGIDIWEKYKEFELILMDCQMPVMDGFEATRQLRSQHCICPIVALTANALQENIDKCLLAGMNDHISKPVKPSALIAKVIGWTRKRS